MSQKVDAFSSRPWWHKIRHDAAADQLKESIVGFSSDRNICPGSKIINSEKTGPLKVEETGALKLTGVGAIPTPGEPQKSKEFILRASICVVVGLRLKSLMGSCRLDNLFDQLIMLHDSWKYLSSILIYLDVPYLYINCSWHYVLYLSTVNPGHVTTLTHMHGIVCKQVKYLSIHMFTTCASKCQSCRSRGPTTANHWEGDSHATISLSWGAPPPPPPLRQGRRNLLANQSWR